MRNEQLDLMNLERFRSEKIGGREEIQKVAIGVLKGLQPIALHQFGSGGKGLGDEFSDLDFFVTLKDAAFEQKVRSREKTYSSVAPVLIRLHNRAPNPIGWYHDLIIHDTDKGLFHVDYYLTPRSKVVLPPDSKLIDGEDNLPTGTWSVDDKSDSAEHDLYEAILAMSFIGVKGVVRGWDSGFFDFLRTLYISYQRDENSNIPDLSNENDFNLISSILTNLQKDGSERQQKANEKIQEYKSQVEQLYKS